MYASNAACRADGRRAGRGPVHRSNGWTLRRHRRRTGREEEGRKKEPSGHGGPRRRTASRPPGARQGAIASTHDRPPVNARRQPRRTSRPLHRLGSSVCPLASSDCLLRAAEKWDLIGDVPPATARRDSSSGLRRRPWAVDDAHGVRALEGQIRPTGRAGRCRANDDGNLNRDALSRPRHATARAYSKYPRLSPAAISA